MSLFQSLLDRFISDSFLNFQGELDLFDVLFVCFWSIFLSTIIAITYRATHRGISYSQNYTQTLVLLGLIVSLVMLIIGTNIARAFTLLGALSIVRFRNAIKETRDVGFIFFVMAIGMACGTRFYNIGIIGTFVGCGLTFFMSYSQFGQKGLAQDVVELNFPVDQDYAQTLSPIFIKHLKYYSLLGVDSVDDKTNRISFIVTFKSKKKLMTIPKKKSRMLYDDALSPKALLLSELQKIESITDIKIIEGTHSIEL